MIAIIDYGSGNIQAIKNIYKRLNIDCQLVSEPADLAGASKIILPGVGAFDNAMAQLNRSGMREVLDVLVLEKNVPVLGVCIGMQIMASSSEEGRLAGLNWIDASIKLLDESKIAHKPKVPHMGWNEVKLKREHAVFQSVDLQRGFYFLHSYYMQCIDSNDVLASANYGVDFDCAINRGNIFGFQFHPEKSHANGIQIFKNFAGL